MTDVAYGGRTTRGVAGEAALLATGLTLGVMGALPGMWQLAISSAAQQMAVPFLIPEIITAPWS